MKKLLPIVVLALAGCSDLGVGGGSVDYGRDEAIAGAAFRVQASEAYAKLNPVCPFTQSAEQLARYDEPRARFQAIGEWVADTPFTVDLAIAEGNYQHFWSVNEVDCGPTDTEESLNAFNAELGLLEGHLSELEKLAGMI